MIEHEAGRPVEVLTLPAEVISHINNVRASADSNRNALGFLPAAVFDRLARRGRLYVAVDSDSREYLGHLLFELRFPHATVMQVFSVASARGAKVATRLVETLKANLKGLGFLAVRARVAEDLTEANRFWSAAGFVIVNRVLGGESTGRRILVRVCELDTPQLFPPSGISSAQPSLGLTPSALTDLPLYLVDLNVIFDLTRQRAFHEEAVALVRSAHLGEFRLAISDEAGRELDRTNRLGKPDPMRGPIEALPRKRLPDTPDVRAIIAQLAAVVFPEKTFPGGLTANDRSDVQHIATAVACDASGFITRDDRIVRVSQEIEKIFGVSVFTPEEFARPIWDGSNKVQVDVLEGGFDIVPFSDEEQLPLAEFLKGQGVASRDLRKWVPDSPGELMCKRVIAKSGNEVVGYCDWAKDTRGGERVQLRLAADEGSELAAEIADTLIATALDEIQASGVCLLLLITPELNAIARRVAFLYGFTAGLGGIQKLSVPGFVGKEGWEGLRSKIRSVGSVSLPSLPPEWGDGVVPFPVFGADGEKRYLTLHDLELLLSPLLFAFQERPCTIVPIRPRFSAQLLGSGPQSTMGPKLRANVSRQRAYFSDPRTLSRYSKNGLILFYESGSRGAKAIIAAGRVMDTYLSRRDSDLSQSLAISVLTEETFSDIGVSATKACCIFESIQWLPKPVSLVQLRSLGIKNSQLLTAFKINPAQADSIFRFGGVL